MQRDLRIAVNSAALSSIGWMPEENALMPIMFDATISFRASTLFELVAVPFLNEVISVATAATAIAITTAATDTTCTAAMDTTCTAVTANPRKASTSKRQLLSIHIY